MKQGHLGSEEKKTMAVFESYRHTHMVTFTNLGGQNTMKLLRNTLVKACCHIRITLLYGILFLAATAWQALGALWSVAVNYVHPHPSAPPPAQERHAGAPPNPPRVIALVLSDEQASSPDAHYASCLKDVLTWCAVHGFNAPVGSGCQPAANRLRGSPSHAACAQERCPCRHRPELRWMAIVVGAMHALQRTCISCGHSRH